MFQHLEALKQHELCQTSGYLKEFIDYIGRKMLVVDIKERAESHQVTAELDRLINAMRLQS